MPRLMFGVIGMGQRGLSYSRLLLKEFSRCGRIQGLADINNKRMTGAASLLGLTDVGLYSDYHDLLADPAIDAVIIATPDFTHETVAQAALRAGKHVLCEKPLATTVDGCYKIFQAKDETQVLHIGFVLRYNRVYQVAQQLIARGDVGKVCHIIATDHRQGSDYFRRWHRLRAKSGGLFNHKSTHTLDIINWFADGKPMQIHASGGLSVFLPGKWQGERCLTCSWQAVCPEYLDLTQEPYNSLYLKAESVDGYIRDMCVYTSDKDTIDHGHVVVEYDNQVKASYNLSLFAPTDNREMTVFGDLGKLELNEASRTITVTSRYSHDTATYNIPETGSGHGGGDAGLMQEFIECIRSGSEPLVGVREGALGCFVGLAAERSVQNHCFISMGQMLAKAGVSESFVNLQANTFE
ncbi:MAG: Gfo/Idh/MocA family oxidoreductase [Firmicutes bacterium]|nr:Gfo/Idh/MocA family oxidoreductase [Bacillota bacterium]